MKTFFLQREDEIDGKQIAMVNHQVALNYSLNFMITLFDSNHDLVIGACREF